MTDLIDPVEVDRALKAKHRAMWAMGDYAAVAHEVVAKRQGSEQRNVVAGAR